MEAIRTMEPTWEKVQEGKFSLSFRIRELPNGGRKEEPYYELSKIECLYIATKFNDEVRAKLVLRWEQLEKEKSPKAYFGWSPMGIDLSIIKETMDSFEITELTGKPHNDVMKAILVMEPAWDKVYGRKFALIQRISDLGKSISESILTLLLK